MSDSKDPYPVIDYVKFLAKEIKKNSPKETTSLTHTEILEDLSKHLFASDFQTANKKYGDATYYDIFMDLNFTLEYRLWERKQIITDWYQLTDEFWAELFEKQSHITKYQKIIEMTWKDEDHCIDFGEPSFLQISLDFRKLQEKDIFRKPEEWTFLYDHIRDHKMRGVKHVMGPSNGYVEIIAFAETDIENMPHTDAPSTVFLEDITIYRESKEVYFSFGT